MRTVWRRVATVSLAIAFTFLTAHFIYAQVDTGSILGTVKDASGAVVPGAKVTIVHEGTGLTLSSLTREDGTYIFTPIRIGTYRVEVEYSGFQKGRRLGIELNIQQQAVVDFSLVPGEITQTVEVTSAAPVLQTQSGSVGEAITSRTIMNLPLSGRNYTFLARLTAGVTHSQPEGRGLNANGWFAANGTRPAQNNYLLDGIDNNSNNVDFLSGAAHVVRPPVDAIAEFKPRFPF
jgi:Carboxypeptidase regulatory-like domain